MHMLSDISAWNRLKELGIEPWNILAITFTNKAANEMKERLEKMIDSTNGMWVCTFHAMCSKILRQHADLLGYSKSFSIYGDTEKESVIKKIMKARNIDPDDKTIRVLKIRGSENTVQRVLDTVCFRTGRDHDRTGKNRHI